jgi:ABC-2 type transport system ATP-binding protein
MSLISVKNLKKEFKVYEKDPGFIGSLKSLVKRKAKLVTAVDSVSFEINEGELLGFIGPNGAGKTTTLKCLSGLLYPDHGTISVMGFQPFERDHQFLKQISLVMGQKNQLWWDLPAQETFKLIKEIYEIEDKKYQKNLKKLVEMLEIEDVLQVQVRKLSLGQRMKCELIAALLHSPKVLFLDEPTIGLDVVMQKKIRQFISDYNQEYQATIILTSHYMEDVKRLCKRVLVINHGRIIYDGLLEDLIKIYADYKVISLTYLEKINKSVLIKYGKITNYNDQKATLHVPRKNALELSSRILDKLPIEDFYIQEPDIEEVIRKMFESKT